MIRLDNIHVTFNAGQVTEKKALIGLSLPIEESEFIAVIGSNGAGKSTLLNTIAGEVRSTQGQLIIDEEDVTKQPAFERARLVARVFQDPRSGTCGDLTIAENLALASRRGQSHPWKTAMTNLSAFKDALSQLNLGLEDRMDTPMSLLSGGQRQAISLLMATLSPMKILLLDEHTSALDPKTAAFVMGLTTTIIEKKKLTALMVTHSLQQALHVGNRTVMLHEGKVIFDVKDPERRTLTVQDLLNKFGVDDDRLLLPS